MDISKAWGYGAVIFPKTCEWQAFVIPDPGSEPFRTSVGKALANAAQVEGETTPSEGTVAAALVQCMIAGNEFGVGVFAAALSEVTERRFWVVDATLDDGGTVTQCSRLDVQSAEEARAEIDRRVMPLKMGQVLKTMTKPSGTGGSR